MAGSGLAASIWSPHRHATTIYTSYTENYKTTIHVSRPGDWDCPSCGFSNFSFRTECLHCRLQCPHTGLQEVAGNIYKTSNASSQLENGAPSHAHPAHDVPVKPHAYSTPTIHSRVKNGLAMSYWAPLRDCSGENQTANGQKIRTKTVSVHAGTPSKLTKLNVPDLGLPYEVQHYILGMMQRIMEEGCYDFAHRWIPQKLIDKKWTCYQQVELSMWRDFLPENCPIESIDPVPGYTLEAALADAVRTRNSAVHRHLCDNIELQSMSLHARDLMFMFGDVTRQDKFHRLAKELWEWDHSGHDLQTRRTRLENALREINEAPIDDMDWSPNVMSLQEISVSPELTHQRQVSEAESLDRMDID